MNVAQDQDDYYDGYRNHATAETVQCRLCGKRFRTMSDVIAQFWVDEGCPDCQRRYTRRAVALLNKAGFTNAYIENIFETGLG